MDKLELTLHLSKTHNVPYVSDAVVILLKQTLLQRKPKRILEIGTGVGYSSAVMHATLPDSHITTIELDPNRHAIASHTLIGSPIECINGDATQILENFVALNQSFDMLFLDGPKGQYARHFELADRLLPSGGIIFADNTSMKKASPDCAAAKGMQRFITTITNHPNYTASVLNIGDGVILAVKN